MITKLDLADAQLLGFGMAKDNPDGILDLVISMGLTKGEWEDWKKNYHSYLDDGDIDTIEKHFQK